MPLYFSTSCLSKYLNFPQILDFYNNLGIKHVELGVCLDPTLDIGSKTINEYNFKYIVHQLFPPSEKPFIINLASKNNSILRKSLNQIKRSIDFCHNCNIRFFSFHGGFMGDPNDNLRFDFSKLSDYEKSFEIFKNSIIEILNYSENKDVKIAIENNVLADYNLINGKNKIFLMCEESEFKRIFREINSKNLAILLDLGHLKVTSNLLKFDAENFVYNLRKKIFALHIHDNNGLKDEHKPVKNNSWVLNMVNKYFKNKEIPIVVESELKNKEEFSRYKSYISNLIF